IRFWRPALYQLELLACISLKEHPDIVHQQTLFRLAMRGVMTASGAEFLTLQAFRRLLFVLSCRVVSFLAVRTLHGNDVAHQAIISSTVPAPTVLPPSRIANRSPFSNATGVINSITRFTLSPGITISTPSGNSADPVTSVVRK